MPELCTELTIDREFSGLCPEPTAEELDILAAGLAAEGCRDPIFLWANHDDTILDGHNRYKICRRENIPFKIKPIKLETRGDCINWIIANQLGRRNLTDEQRAFLRGKRYQAEKRADLGHGDQKSGDQNDPPITDVKPDKQVTTRTADRLGKAHGVSAPTIKRDAKFAEAVDTIGETVGDDAKAKILAGKSGLTKQAVVKAAKLPPKKMAAAVARPVKPPKSGRQRTPRNRFQKLTESIGACLRQTDALHKDAPADKFHRATIASLKNAINTIENWQKAVR